MHEAQSPGVECLAAEAFERRSMWRPAIEALQESVNLKDDPAVRDNLEKLRAERGFRMTDYKVDTEAATPRVCVQFSEELAKGQVDYAADYRERARKHAG